MVEFIECSSLVPSDHTVPVGYEVGMIQSCGECMCTYSLNSHINVTCSTVSCKVKYMMQRE